MPTLAIPPRHLWFQTKNYSLLSKYLQNFDVIHNLDPRLGLLAHLSKKLHKPLITHVHECAHCMTATFLNSPISYWSPGDFVFSVLEYPINEGLNRSSLYDSDHVIVCSKTRFRELSQNYKHELPDVSVIYNGINFDGSADSTSSAETNKLSILFWGRLYYVKGIIHLIYALKLVVQDYPEVMLEICGKGPLEPQIKTLAKKLGIEKNVKLNGYVSKKVLSEKINKATVVALPSLHEGQPMAALEAMAYGKCVVMYDYPFAREFITDGFNGLLSRSNNIKSMAQQISFALSDKKLQVRLGQNAYKSVRKAHDWAILTPKYIEIYKKLASAETF